MFRTVPLSIIRSFSLYTQQWFMSYRFSDSLRAGSVLILLASCQQTCMTCTIAACTVKNAWWWTEELSETCSVLFQKLIWEINASGLFCFKNYLTMDGHLNVILDQEEMICETNLMQLLWFINQHLAQHVSGTIMPIFRSARLYMTAYGFQHLVCWLVTASVV